MDIYKKTAKKIKLVLHVLPWVFPLSSSVVVVEKVCSASRIQSSFCHHKKLFKQLQISREKHQLTYSD